MKQKKKKTKLPGSKVSKNNRKVVLNPDTNCIDIANLNCVGKE